MMVTILSGDSFFDFLNVGLKLGYIPKTRLLGAPEVSLKFVWVGWVCVWLGKPNLGFSCGLLFVFVLGQAFQKFHYSS